MIGIAENVVAENNFKKKGVRVLYKDSSFKKWVTGS